MKFNLTTTARNPKDNEEVYTYTGENGMTVKFQADPKRAFSWLFYVSSTAPAAMRNKLVKAFCKQLPGDVRELSISDR